MEKSLVDQYRAKFEELKKQVEFMRSLLRESGLLDSAIDTSKIDELRDKLLTAFDKEKIAKEHSGPNACHCCHYESWANKSPLKIYDIAYLLVKNPDFRLPEPDWDSLTEDNPKQVWVKDIGGEGYADMKKCLFLGPQGCLYGENRPAVCLSYLCHGAVRAVAVDSKKIVPEGYYNYSPLGKAVFKAIGLPPDFQSLGSVVSGWFYKVLLPKTGKSEQEITSVFNQA